MGLLELIQQKSFIGKEFLSWLWYRAETDPLFSLADGKRCEIEIMGPILLDAHYGDARSTTLRGESPATAPEAATALMEGKKLKRARVKLSTDGVDFIATIDGDNFNVSGLNLPKSGQLPFEEVLRLRMDYVLEYETMFADLFQQFLSMRLDENAWTPEIEKVQAWVGGK